jgi:release factor glutamine methyltransferase
MQLYFALDVSKILWQQPEKNATATLEVTFISQNILETLDLKQQFDIIVSNPPYVRNLEKHNQMFWITNLIGTFCSR